MTLVGGKRDRMLLQSIFNFVRDELDILNWFDVRPSHSQVFMVDIYPEEEEQVLINTLAVSVGDTHYLQAELGSNAEEHHTPIYFDFYAQSDGIGRHMVGDIYSILMRNPVIPVYDLDLATPTIDFYVEVVEETVEKQRPLHATNAWQKHWNVVFCQVRDFRTNA